MKIKKFRIKNYKSIVDSGDCYVEQDLTIFAGKNESGKTSVLEALENFNTDINIPDNAKPIGRKEALPEIIITLTFTAEEVNEYFERVKIEKKNTKEQEIVITKGFPNTYTVDDATAKLFELKEDSSNNTKIELETKIKAVYQEIKKVHAHYFTRHGWPLFSLNLQDMPNLDKHLNLYFQKYRTSYRNQILNHTIKKKHQEKIQELKELLFVYKNESISLDNHWAIFFEKLPNFILFSSFEDIIPNEVPFVELEKSEFIKDLEIISNIDVPLIKSNNRREQLQHNKDINIQFNRDYSKFWLQDLTEIKINWNNNILEFWIEEDNTLFKPSERSKGKQWHMSFYIKITARAIEKKANIILVDEPGLCLHATAQNDIYKNLIDRSQKSQIFYTTHSPYLLNKDELHRVRLVLKGPSIKHGTLIENKIHARADKETLTPILTAIGLGLSDGIQNINQEKNIVIEGPADYFYLQGLKLLLKENSFNFIYGGGSGNMGNVGAILTGWGCKVIYLYDNDQGLKDGSRNLTKVWLVKSELIHSIKEDVGRIEDLFSKIDFQNQILREGKAKIETTNSDFIKKNSLDKVLLARLFNSHCHTDEVKLSAKTLELCKNLFERLGTAFKNLNGQTDT